MNDLVILVNEQDQEIGTMPKLEAHQKGVLHRAFSVFIFNESLKCNNFSTNVKICPIKVGFRHF